MTVITPAKVARNLTRSFFEIGHKRCNSSDHISMSEICAWELRATLLGNQPDWKPTHETAAWVHWYNTRRPHLALGGITPQQAENQHTTTRKEAASTSLHKTRDLTNNARATVPVTWRDTRYGALHPIRRGVMPTDRVHCPPRQAQLRTVPPDTPKRQHQTQPHNLEIPARLRTRGATPDPSRYTRSEGVHCLRIGCAPNHKNKRGICETIADTPPTRRRTAPHAANPHRPSQDRCTGGES